MFAGLNSDKYDRQYTDRYLFRRLGSFFQGQGIRIAGMTASGLLVSVVQALSPIIIAAGVDAVEKHAGTPSVLLLVGALLTTVLIQYAANWLRRRLTNRVVSDLVARMRGAAFEAAIRRDMAFYDENKTGKVLSRITNDTDEFGQVLIVTSDVISQIIQTVILGFVLVGYDLGLTLVMMGFSIPILIITLMFRKVARAVTRQGSRAMAAVNDTIQETVTGISVAKNFRKEAMIYDEFVQVNTQSYRINLRRGVVLATIFPMLNAAGGIATALIVYLGALAAINGTLSLSLWYLYIQAVDRFWMPLINIATYWNQFQQAMSSLERIFALIDAENSVRQTGSRPADGLRGQIEFRDVGFRYKSGDPVLAHFDLSIRPGENVAFVGHTGAGKSTIAKLITRMYEFQNGQILIDGLDIRGFDLTSFRRQLGFVPQAPFLFSGTIMDNIRYGRPDATDAEIEAIAHSVGNGEWLETLPDGLQSDVGERGARLSMGQRQLVSLLRVLVERPAIFILDEATASIDTFTELQIQEALALILKQSTSILIAHRLSTVRSADRIIVLENGGIIEQGSHDQLMAGGGHYAELYNTYFRHQSLSYVENARALLSGESASAAG